MGGSMKISIVVSTYNGMEFIEEQMDSLLNQSRNADEVLFFDDCSTDDTAFIIKEYILRHKIRNWHMVINKVNKGWKRNFMEGLWQATGDLIFPCDQDDIWMQDKLKVMECLMASHPEINVLTTNCQAFYDTGKIIIRPEPENRQLIKQPLVQNIFNTKYPGCTYCIRKSFVELSRKYWEDDFPHDALFWRMGVFSETLYSYNESLIQWRRHNDSTYTLESAKSKTASNKRQWIDYAIRVVQSLKKFIAAEGSSNIENGNCILNTTLQWLNSRALFYDKKSLYQGIYLLKYLKCYDRVRQYVGDWYLIYFKSN